MRGRDRVTAPGARRCTSSIIAFVLCFPVGSSHAAAICADELVDAREQCDDGGMCVGGSRAGAACESEAECLDGGACFGGLDDLRACDSDDDCRMGSCRRCRPFGGDGCAANCTLETGIAVELVDGVIHPSGDSITFGTSGAVIHNTLATIPLPFSGSMRLTAGRSIDQVSPVVIKANDLDLARVPVSTIACACVRTPSPSTCGGTLRQLDGTPSLSCTPGFNGAVECPIDRPCAPVHGPGNASSGFIGCGGPSVSVDLTHDCNPMPGGPPFPALLTTQHEDGPGVLAEGNALLAITAAIGFGIGPCSGSEPVLGPDGEFCTDDDPIESRGAPSTLLFSTGAASGTILNPSDFTNDVLGPYISRGRAFACNATDGSIDISDGVLTSAFTACDQPTLADNVGPLSLAFARAPKIPGVPPAPCAGDCDRFGDVTVDELVMLIAIALGSRSLESCTPGDVDRSGSITVDEVIVAVSRALNGCAPPPDEDICANESIDAGEQCDDGGVCVGGPLAGTNCTAEAQCLSGGACFGGLDDLRACNGDDDCRGGDCRRCRPVGGDGCAANCTMEIETTVELVPGIINGRDEPTFGTSVAQFFGALIYFPLPLGGGVALTTGRAVDGVMPVVLRSDAVRLGGIQVATSCACFRFPALSTCGGTSFEVDGTPSVDCTAGFEGAAVCPTDKPCAPVNGAGNAASGFITCGAPPVAIDAFQDCNGTPGAAPFPPVVSVANSSDPGVTDRGNALLTTATALGTVVGSCSGTTADYGADGRFCTPDDPINRRGIPSISLVGTDAAALIANSADFEGDFAGPFPVRGAPFTCGADGSVDISGAGIATAYTICDFPTAGDSAVPAVLFFGDAQIIPGNRPAD